MLFRSFELPPSYDVNFDRQNFNEPLIRRNLETDLGERFNVVISRVNYQFDGQFLISRGDNEPFIESIKKGIEKGWHGRSGDYVSACGLLCPQAGVV